MKQVQFVTLLFLLLGLVFNLPGSEVPPASKTIKADVDYKVMSWRERYLQLGQDTYHDACAQCHDEGDEGAPVTGDQASWSDRSPLWSAVLIVHAQNGYLGMPAKGGCATLTEHQVAAAGEYMLSETFPELPRD